MCGFFLKNDQPVCSCVVSIAKELVGDLGSLIYYSPADRHRASSESLKANLENT